jgi:ankyrin repeat protein
MFRESGAAASDDPDLEPLSAAALGAALLTAAKLGDVARMQKVLSRGCCDVNARDRVGGASALHWAVGSGHVACANALLAARADVHLTTVPQ